MQMTRVKAFFGQGFGTREILNDLGAGVTKSIDSVTGGMANALLAGVNPIYGLYKVSMLIALVAGSLLLPLLHLTTVPLVEVVADEQGYPVERPAPRSLPNNQVTFLTIYGSLFSAGARNLAEELPDADETCNAAVILNLRGYNELGATTRAANERAQKLIAAQQPTDPSHLPGTAPLSEN